MPEPESAGGTSTRPAPRRRGATDALAPLVIGATMGAAAVLIYRAIRDGRGVDPHLILPSTREADVPPVVVVPGILGSELVRPDGTIAWLNLGNTVGYHDLSLPLKLPLRESRDDLVPRGLLGVDTVLPRLFGFTEYSELLELLERARYRRDPIPETAGPSYHVFTYDWRRDLFEAVRALDETLEQLADRRGDPRARFSVVGHSLGGLVVRYYLRFGAADPASNPKVTWEGARRIANVVLVGVPSGGSIPSLDAILNGNRVGFSSTTLAAGVISRCPSVYTLLPPKEVPALLDHRGDPLDADLLDAATWDRFGWGPYAPSGSAASRPGDSRDAQIAYLSAVLERARQIHAGLAREPADECPSRVFLFGGDCLPTLGRAIVPERRGLPPLFAPRTRAEGRSMFESGDGRVTRSSVLASHIEPIGDGIHETGIPEVEHAFFADADHHGYYGAPTFQSLLLRILTQPPRDRVPAVPEPAGTAQLP